MWARAPLRRRACRLEPRQAPRCSGSCRYNDAALLRLVGALLIEQNDEWLIARRYLSQESLELVLVDESSTEEATQLNYIMRLDS